MNDDIERSRSRPCAARVLAIRAPFANKHARRTAVVKQASVLKSSTAKLLLSRRSAVRVAAIRAAKLGCHDACARQSIHVRSMHSTCRCINFVMNKKTLVHFSSLKLRRTPSRQACLKLAYGLGLGTPRTSSPVKKWCARRTQAQNPPNTKQTQSQY